MRLSGSTSGFHTHPCLDLNLGCGCVCLFRLDDSRPCCGCECIRMSSHCHRLRVQGFVFGSFNAVPEKIRRRERSPVRGCFIEVFLLMLERLWQNLGLLSMSVFHTLDVRSRHPVALAICIAGRIISKSFAAIPHRHGTRKKYHQCESNNNREAQHGRHQEAKVYCLAYTRDSNTSLRSVHGPE